tara:strand:- start:636 stop:977 length:342 start_codon:yes stop_codon:yes gene_type:complete
MSNSIRNKKICFTGKLDDFTRADLEHMAKEYGFVFQPSVNRQTDILVMGEAPGKTKVDKAHKLGVRIWQADDFLMMLSQDENDGIMTVPLELSPEEQKKRAAHYEEDDMAGMF